MDANVYVGFEQYGTTGLVNNADVVETAAVASGTGGSTKWADKIPKQILEDINNAITAVWAASEYDEDAIPNHILIPYEQYSYITTTISTVVDGEVKDTQTAQTVEDLIANDWVEWSGTGKLTATIGATLTGGADGTVAPSAYSAFVVAIEPYKFDSLIYDGTDSTVRDAMERFIKRVNTETGTFCQLVESGASGPDSRFIINVGNGVVLSDGTTLTAAQTCWWAGGVASGATYAEDLTNAVYPNAVDVSPRLTHSQYVEAINKGQFVFNVDDGTVRVEYDLDSLTTFTTDIGEVYRYNRTMRLCNTIANDLRAQFAQNFMGIVDNTEDGRRQYKSAIVKYLTQLQASGGIQNFDAENDVIVEKGEAKDAVLITLAIEAVGSTNKIYITLEVA